MSNPNELPGSDLLRLPGDLLSGTSGSASRDSSLVNTKGASMGGGGRARRPADGPPSSDLEPMDIPLEEEAREEKPKVAEAVLSEAAWTEPDTLFQKESEVTVKVSLPPGQGHITRIEVELHANRPTGPELIAKGEGNAGKDGKAAILMPVYKPKNHAGEVVEYFLVFKHKLAKLFQPKALIREVLESARKSEDHSLVPGIVFDTDSSFIKPKIVDGLKTLESKIQDWEKKYPKGKIVIYGHANQGEKDAKALSERRAQSVHAFITNDVATWDKLYSLEKWGLAALQHLLLDLGYYKSTPDNKDGPGTQAAFKAFQKKSGLPETGKEDSGTRKALFGAYMKGKHDIKIDAERFRKVAGNSWMGCAANNRVKEGKEPAAENRRVAFLLINESRLFPVHFPCQDGNETACARECKKEGKRSSAGIKCAFYDELVREEAQAPAVESAPPEDSPDAMERIGFEGHSGRGYVIKDFKKFAGGAIQLDPDKIIPGGDPLPKGFNNQCVSFVKYFGLPQTSTWKKGPRVCDLKPGELPEGTVVATLRDGKYYSDSSGRSHVGIYLSHDDYQQYLASPNVSSAVHMMDQYFGARIDRRQKKYSTNANEEKTGSPAKKPWTDPEGNEHEYRVKWVDDGEEYFVVLTDS